MRLRIPIPDLSLLGRGFRAFFRRNVLNRRQTNDAGSPHWFAHSESASLLDICWQKISEFAFGTLVGRYQENLSGAAHSHRERFYSRLVEEPWLRQDVGYDFGS